LADDFDPFERVREKEKIMKGLKDEWDKTKKMVEETEIPKSFVDEKLEKMGVSRLTDKEVKQQLKEEFDEKVKKCKENQKKLICNYDKDMKISTPWACKVCDCKDGTFGNPWDCKPISAVRYIYSVYPDFLDLGVDNNFEMVLPPDTGIKRNDPEDYLICGDKKKTTLKMTQNGNPKLIRKPDNVSIEKVGKYNTLMYAKRLHASMLWDGEFQIAEKLVPKEKLFSPRIIVGDKSYIVTPIWKDDFSDEYDIWTNKKFVSSFLPKMPPPGWGDIEALREWIANAIDVTPENKKVKLYKDKHNNVVLEYDTPEKLQIKHMCCTGSHEERDNSIGKFGEGIKVGTIIFTRKNKFMKVETIGETYYPTWEYDNLAKSYLMTTYILPNDRKTGTKVTILNTGDADKLINETKPRFLKWRDDYQLLFDDGYGNQILSIFENDEINTRNIAVRGVRTNLVDPSAEGPRMLFNYNLHNDDILDRDRRIPDISDASNEIQNLFLKLDDYDVILKICAAYNVGGSRYTDLQQWWSKYGNDFKEPDLWKKAVTAVLKGTPEDKIAIKTGGIRDKNLMDFGYNLVDWGDGNRLLESFGYKRADAFPQSLGKPRVINIEKLLPKEKENLEAAFQNLKLLIIEYYGRDNKYADDIIKNSFVADSFEGTDEAESLKNIQGMYRSGEDINETGKIYLLRSILDDPVITTGVLIHEFLHKYSGYGDETRGFENAFTDLSGYTGHHWSQIKQALLHEIKKTGKPLPWLPKEEKNIITEINIPAEKEKIIDDFAERQKEKSNLGDLFK